MTLPSDAVGLSLAQLRARIAAGALEPADVVAAHRQRARAIGPGLNAFTEVSAEAGVGAGALAGVPVAVKDVFVDGGRAPSMGSKVQPAGMVGTAAVLELLRGAGASVIGYTNLHEWGIGTTSAITATGPIRNPWDRTRIAGGSSGGSAAAVAAGIVPVAIGTDAGGSVRIPAACCGVVGLKPTFGAIPLDGAVAAASELDTVGVIARTVADVASLFGVLTGRVPGYIEVADLRLGIPHNFFFDDIQDEVRVAVDAAVDALSGVIDVVPVPMDGIEHARDVVARSLLPFVAGLVEHEIERRPDQFAAATLKALRLGLRLRDEPRGDAEAVRAAWRGAFEMCDVVVTPTVPAVTPRIDQPKVDLPSGPQPVDVKQIAFNAPMNVSGIPALSIPCGEVGGLPVSLTVSARHGAEDLLVSVGRTLEECLDGAYSGRVAPDVGF